MYHGERFNSISHLIGAGAAVAGASSLITAAAFVGDPWKIVSTSIYGAMLVLLYVFSTIYHSVRGNAKPALQKMDHIAIYLLIAGTYTPFTLVTLRGEWGWTLFGLNWGLAVFGIIQEFIWGKGRRILSLVIYALMGWMVVIAYQPLTHNLPFAGLIWLVAGGLTYTLGIVFFVLDDRMRHAHGIWHLFVLGGSVCHFWCIYRYIVMTP